MGRIYRKKTKTFKFYKKTPQPTKIPVKLDEASNLRGTTMGVCVAVALIGSMLLALQKRHCVTTYNICDMHQLHSPRGSLR
jgi:hypothetical protein